MTHKRLDKTPVEIIRIMVLKTLTVKDRGKTYRILAIMLSMEVKTLMA
jgi:hypothetical protein